MNPEIQKDYQKGFSVADLFPVNSAGIVTAPDSFTIHKTKEQVKNTIETFLKLDNEDAQDWQVEFAKKDLKEIYPEKRTPNLNMEIVNQIAKNLGLTFIPEKEPEGKVCYINNPEVRDDYKTTFAPIDLLDYIYAVLHSPGYREKYKEFLKIDFPGVPYPAGSETFWKLVRLGSQLREVHLLESPKVNEFITSYPVDGDNTVTRKMTAKSPGWEPANAEKTKGRVWINDAQYFDGVPLVAWNFFNGSYQPAQKWLKDRHGRTLSFEDILHYQKIIAALTETHRLMQEVDQRTVL